VGGWITQAQLAVRLDRPIEGQVAGRELLALGAEHSVAASTLELLAALEQKGWLQLSRQTGN